MIYVYNYFLFYYLYYYLLFYYLCYYSIYTMQILEFLELLCNTEFLLESMQKY